jgi:SAF domain-containing protein
VSGAPGRGPDAAARRHVARDDWHATALADADNVATLLRDVAAGETVIVRAPAGLVEVIARDPIALGHKIALCDLAAGARILKYGECIGEATGPVARGEWVHTHNLRSRRAQAAGRPHP